MHDVDGNRFTQDEYGNIAIPKTDTIYQQEYKQQ